MSAFLDAFGGELLKLAATTIPMHKPGSIKVPRYTGYDFGAWQRGRQKQVASLRKQRAERAARPLWKPKKAPPAPPKPAPVAKKIKPRRSGRGGSRGGGAMTPRGARPATKVRIMAAW